MSVKLLDTVRLTIRDDLPLLLDINAACCDGTLPLPLRGGYSDGAHGDGEKLFEAADRPALERWLRARRKRLRAAARPSPDVGADGRTG